jgi:hypothetical protein
MTGYNAADLAADFWNVDGSIDHMGRRTHECMRSQVTSTSTRLKLIPGFHELEPTLFWLSLLIYRHVRQSYLEGEGGSLPLALTHSTGQRVSGMC